MEEKIKWNGSNIIELDKFCGDEEDLLHRNGDLYIPLRKVRLRPDLRIKTKRKNKYVIIKKDTIIKLDRDNKIAF